MYINATIKKEESELIEAFEEQLSYFFSKMLQDGALHKFYRIKQIKRSSASEI